MKVFAISDLHISTTEDKPMTVFGSAWDNYLENIRADWSAKVSCDDLVILSGDLSWAMTTENARKDISVIADLPGKKVIIRGNHDYWWSGKAKVQAILPENMYAIQNDCIKFGNVIICGSRLWTVPNNQSFTEEDNKLYLREAERLKLSFNAVRKIREEKDKVIAAVHYPPFNVKRENTLYTEMFEANGVKAVVYGHLHGKDVRADMLVEKGGIKYYLTSCDLVKNKLVEIDL